MQFHGAAGTYFWDAVDELMINLEKPPACYRSLSGPKCPRECPQISQKFLSEIAPPMQAFSGKPPREKPQNAAADYCALWGFWCLSMANWVRYPLPLF